MELGGLEPPTSWVRCRSEGRYPVRDDVDDRLAELDEVERRMRRIRPLTQQQRLEHSLTRRLLDTYAAWLSEVGREWRMPDPRAD